jgi:hypothetical protein
LVSTLNLKYDEPPSHFASNLNLRRYSKAVQAVDLQTGMLVCMKIIKNNKDFFDQSLDEARRCRMTLG